VADKMIPDVTCAPCKGFTSEDEAIDNLVVYASDEKKEATTPRPPLTARIQTQCQLTKVNRKNWIELPK